MVDSIVVNTFEKLCYMFKKYTLDIVYCSWNSKSSLFGWPKLSLLKKNDLKTLQVKFLNDCYVKDNLLISERRLVFKESSTSPLAKETEAQVFFLFQSSN